MSALLSDMLFSCALAISYIAGTLLSVYDMYREGEYFGGSIFGTTGIATFALLFYWVNVFLHNYSVSVFIASIIANTTSLLVLYSYMDGKRGESASAQEGK